jgi:hypothetical protein
MWKRPENARGKLTGLHLVGQIPSGETYPLAETIAGSGCPVAVRLLPISGGGLKKSGPDSLPGTPTAEDEHLGRGYADFFLREEQRLVTQGTLEGLETSG